MNVVKSNKPFAPALLLGTIAVANYYGHDDLDNIDYVDLFNDGHVDLDNDGILVICNAYQFSNISIL